MDDCGLEYVKIRHSTIEIYGILKDKSKAADYPSDLGKTIQARSFDPIHQYTDADYEKMMEIWKNEYVRGADTLYWRMSISVTSQPPSAKVPGIPAPLV